MESCSVFVRREHHRVVEPKRKEKRGQGGDIGGKAKREKDKDFDNIRKRERSAQLRNVLSGAWSPTSLPRSSGRGKKKGGKKSRE